MGVGTDGRGGGGGKRGEGKGLEGILGGYRRGTSNHRGVFLFNPVSLFFSYNQ